MRYIISALLGSMLFVANAAQANECELSIDGNDNMRFDTKEMSVPASCDEVTVTLHHSGDMQSVVQQGMSAGMDNNYVPDSDAVIAATDVIGGGEETSVTFSTEGMSADTDYKFFCTFPGHSAIMQGSFAIKE